MTAARDCESPIDMTTDAEFTIKERELIRLEFMERMGGHRSLAEGILIRRWATGPNKGRPKFPAAVQTMLDRGFVSFTDDGKRWPAVHFTDAGWRALRRLAADKRALAPAAFAHLIEDLAASDRGR